MSGSCCRAEVCRARVRWVASAATGRWMILDAEPVDGGNVAVVDDGPAGTFAHVNPAPEVPGPRYVVHQTTCLALNKKGPDLFAQLPGGAG